jgi:SPP1 family predicted phage head-tail adaptor
MRSGRMRHRVVIQTQTESRDTHGGVSRTWADTATRWASIEPLRGREFYSAQQVNANVTHKIGMRYYSGLTPTHRLKFGTRIFNIVDVRLIKEIKNEMEILATEVIA